MATSHRLVQLRYRHNDSKAHSGLQRQLSYRQVPNSTVGTNTSTFQVSYDVIKATEYFWPL